MIATIFLSLVFTLGLWLPASVPDSPLRQNIPLIVIFVLGFGFSSGSNISLTPVCVGQLCETEELGRYFATCYTVVSFGCLTGLPVGGAILRIDGGEFGGVVGFTGACYGAGMVCFVVARALKVGWGWKRVY